LLSVPGSDEHGALATALDKLARALGVTEGLAVEVGEPRYLDALRRATAESERVEIEYYSFGRDATTTRQVDPRSVFHAFGHWYAAAYCHEAADERLFRLDRIRAVRQTGTRFEAPAPDDAAHFGRAVYHPRADDPRVTLELAPEAAWVVESFPSEEAEERPDGSSRVVLAISERAWLERLLLQLGRAARVVAPPELQSVGTEAAARLLTRYRR
jgi:proteasome accessory factor C